MIPAFPVYLFDVDGTLLDSQLDICGAILTVFANRGRTDVTHEQLVPYIGRHLLEEFADFGFRPEELDDMLAEYRQVYPQRKHANTSVYGGVHDALGRLGGKKATATTKGTPTTKAVLEHFELIGHFDHIQGTDGFPAKPEPNVLYKSIEALGVRPEDCLFVGDSPSDMEAGRRAGIRTCAVTWGYGDPAVLAKFEPDFWAHSPYELLPE